MRANFNLPPMIDAKQIGELIGVHPRTVLNMHDRGELPEGRRLTSRVLRWPTAEILEFVGLVDSGAPSKTNVVLAGNDGDVEPAAEPGESAG